MADENKIIQTELFSEEEFKDEEFKEESPKRSPRGQRKIPKGRLVVTFPDDSPIVDNAYVKTIRRIGTEKIERTNLRFAGRKLITATKQYPSQTNLPDGKWLTIPNTTKDKYKMLKIISSMTHTPFEVEITK